MPPPADICNYGESGTIMCGEEGWFCFHGSSPIIIDTNGKGFRLTSAGDGVVFDIQGDGHPTQMAWTAKGSSNAFLALDRNHNGKIDNGTELFGNFTQQSPSADPNGFLALAEFDKPENGGNGDGIIDRRDWIFSQLVLWIDENHDGISQPKELHGLPELGVYSLALRYRESRRTDEFGNQFRYSAAVNPDPDDGESKDGRVAYDVFFVDGKTGSRGTHPVAKGTGLGRSSFFGGNYQNGELQDPLGPNWRPVNRGRHPMVVPAGVENQIQGEIMKPKALLLAGVCGMSPALCAQQVATSPTVNLKPTSKVELPLSSSMEMIERVKCDAAGNIYARPLNVASHSSSDEARIPLVEITREGKLATTFQASAPGLEDAVTGHVFLHADGRVYQLVGSLVVEFAKDGSVKSRTRPQTGADVNLRHLAVFKSGRFLLTGETDGDRNTPFAAVFEPDGRLVKKIYEPEDEYARGRAKAGDSEYANYVAGRSLGNNFAGRGDVTVGDDGNAYLMHGASPTIVYVISPAGEVLRKFRVASSEPGRAAWSIKSYGNRLAFSYPVGEHLEIQVTDLEGNPVGAYAINPKSKPDVVDTLDLACYNANGFTLVSVEASGNLYLLNAKPKQ